MTKVVFIDWNKTLSYDLFWGHLQNPNHPNHKHLKRIEKWIFVDNRDKINPWMRGGLSLDDIVIQMSNDTGVSEALIIDELRSSCETMTFSLEGIRNLVENIQKNGIKVVIATDNMDTFSRYTVPALGLDEWFDAILNSHDIGFLKDDEKPMNEIPFFDDYLTANGWEYSDAILLDDSPDKSGKYARLGFERVLIDSPETLRKSLERFAYAK